MCVCLCVFISIWISLNIHTETKSTMRRQHGLTESKNVRRINVQNLWCKSPRCRATCGCTLGTARQARLHGCRPCTWDKKYVQHNSANKKRNNWSVIRLAGLVCTQYRTFLKDLRFPMVSSDTTYPQIPQILLGQQLPQCWSVLRNGFAFPTWHQSLFHLILFILYRIILYINYIYIHTYIL